MKIDKEQFNKLKQLDRIEFRQKRTEIDERFRVGFGTFISYMYLLLTYLVIYILCNIYSIINQSSVRVQFCLWIFLILPIGYVLDIYSMYRNSKETNKLCNEYFKVEVEVKKK